MRTKQLAFWTGEFGAAYISRNSFEDWMLEPGTQAFKKMLTGITPTSILEVGANIGLNLIYLNSILGNNCKIFALEPNKAACAELERQHPFIECVLSADAFSIPLNDNSIELVFTSGVLVHIAPHDLDTALEEIHRVSSKYILCNEYFSDEPEEKIYRGNEGLLFKRDFGSYYLDKFCDLKCVGHGFLWKREYKIFDNSTWWLFEKA